MGFSTDLVGLVFYLVTLVASVLVGLWQAVEWARSGKPPLLQIGIRSLIRTVLGIYLYFPMMKVLGRLFGWYLRSRSELRRSVILSRLDAGDHKQPNNGAASSGEEDSWEKVGLACGTPITSNPSFKGIIGFFHPFCNAGGGGERVLWAAIRATQVKYPNAVCIVYTGDHDATKQDILSRVQTRFNIRLNPRKIFFQYLSTRRYVLASTWPRFTLLGQSLGSILLALDAFWMLVPDVFIDTMGYAFALGFSKFCFPDMPTAAYVHYPTISTDMLGSLDSGEDHGVNSGAGKGFRGLVKRQYWQLFARAYRWVGGSVDVVMTNSSWTCSHIQALWGPSRKANGKTSKIAVVFPPVAVEEITRAIEVSGRTESDRQDILLYIAQFRPEKNHKMILKAFSKLINSSPDNGSQKEAKLVLIGSVRDSDDATRVYELRLLAHEYKIKEQTEFICDATWSQILKWLKRSSVGINGMWNEHFGIGVVEYQAAGLISVVNDSGGPRDDIVVTYDGGPTGFHASSPDEYASAFQKALNLSSNAKIAMRRRARGSAGRFNEEEFAKRWLVEIDNLIGLRQAPKPHLHPRRTRTIPIAAGYVALLAYDMMLIKA